MAETYKIGQILTLSNDITVKRALSDKTETVPKGSKVIIGADRLAHHMRDGSIQPLSENAKVEGYDTEGIAEFITNILDAHICLKYILEDGECSVKEFKEELVYALNELGM